MTAKKTKAPARAKTLEPLSYRRSDLPTVTGLGLRTLDRALAEGALRSFRRGRCRLVRRDALQEFLAETAS
jgi:excisionase family DNA binding protein